MPYYIYGLFYLIIINLAALFVTVADKRRAILHRRRVPERTLFTLALLGGSFFMMITMLLIRHKTKHLKFMLGIPAIMILQTAIPLFIFFKAIKAI